MNLPAEAPGAIVAISDYARNFSTYAFTIAANGSELIGGSAQDAILTTDGQAATLVYVDGTKGWVNVQNASDTFAGALLFLQQLVEILQLPVEILKHIFLQDQAHFVFRLQVHQLVVQF